MHCHAALPRRARLLAFLALLAMAAAGSPLAPTPPVGAQATARSWSRSAVWAPSFDGGALLDPGGADGSAAGVIYVADRGHDRIAVVNRGGAIIRTFGRRGEGPGELREPADLALDAARDRVYVVDRGNRRIAVFDLAGNPIAGWTSAGPDAGFVPHAVAVAPSGDVYVLSRLPWGRVERFSPDGTWRAGWGDIGSGRGQFESPEDLAVDAMGRVLVADTNNDRIQIFAAGDNPVVETVWPRPGVTGLAVDRGSGFIYALHGGPGMGASVVSAYSAPGQAAGQLTSGQPEPFASAAAIGFAAGRLLVSTGAGTQDGRQGLRQFEAAGLGLAAATLANPLDHAGFIRPVSIDTAPDGSVLLADAALGVARRYEPDGSFRARLDGGAGNALAVGPAGEVYLADTPILGDVRLRRLRADGLRAWDKVCDCLSGMGLAASADRIYATSAHEQRIAVFDTNESRSDPIGTIGFGDPDPPYAWPMDLDLGLDGRLYAAGGSSGQVEIFQPGSGRREARWPVAGGGGAERISLAPDGTVFVLHFDGRLGAYAADGRLEQLWLPEPPQAGRPLRPLDLAAGPGGRLYVLDGASDSVLVFDAQAAAPSPTPVATPASAPCTVQGDKTAAPARVELGQPVTVELSLDIRCRPGAEPRADIVLVLDRSNSMAGFKLSGARAAAKGFVAGLDLARHRVAVISFSDLVTLDQPLTGDRAAIDAAIDRLRTDGRTDIAGALDRAGWHLSAAGRPGALPVVLLLTDGKPSREGQPYVDAVRQGERIRARGGLTYAIGLGDDVVASLLTAVAGSAERYFFAPDPEDLDPIYALLSQNVGEVVATDVRVSDRMGPEVDFVPGSAQPQAQLSGDQLDWSLNLLPSGGARFRLQVLPRRTGRLPTNTEAIASYTAEGQRYSFRFPVPEVEVVAPVTPTPTRPPTATPQHKTAYLPFLARGLCLPKDARLGADIVLVIDSSASMRGAKLAEAVAAAKVFLAEVDPRRDRVGLVSFDSDARREHVLTQDMAAVGRRLDGLTTQIGTRLDRGLEEAARELEYRGRRGAAPVIVLLSDGVPSAGTADRARVMAFTARASGATLVTIGLGSDSDGLFLRELASSPSHYYFAPEASGLTEIYRRIAGNLPCPS